MHVSCMCHGIQVALEIQMAMEEAQALQQSMEVQHMQRS